MRDEGNLGRSIVPISCDFQLSENPSDSYVSINCARKHVLPLLYVVTLPNHIFCLFFVFYFVSKFTDIGCHNNTCFTLVLNTAYLGVH